MIHNKLKCLLAMYYLSIIVYGKKSDEGIIPLKNSI